LITQAVFKILQQDITDITTAQALAKMTKDNSEIVLADIAPYHYQSIRTLVGEAANNIVDAYGNYDWAEKHIVSYEKNYNVEVVQKEKSARPLIVLSAYNFKSIANEFSKCTLSIAVLTDAKVANSLEAFYISERIKSRFIYNPPGGCLSARIFNKEVKGMKNLIVNPLGYDEFSKWDYSKSLYEVSCEIYGAVNA
jgi:hypothetical protein